MIPMILLTKPCEEIIINIFDETNPYSMRNNAERRFEQFLRDNEKSLRETDDKELDDKELRIQMKQSKFWEIYDSCRAILKNSNEGGDFHRAKWFIETVSSFIEKK
ncbi:MAG: hypothetical protein ACFFD4_02295 [Candidatus Odinarchaeota archaeon]